MWQSNFTFNKKGDRVLKKSARKFFDKNREKGSASIHKDHTISIKEQLNDIELATYFSKEEVKVPKYYSVEDKNKYDMVNQPKHYMFNIDGHDVQAVDILKGTLTPEEFRGWLKGSYLTYVLRADRKNGLEDLKKANTFLNWQIQFDNGEELTLPGKNDKKILSEAPKLRERAVEHNIRMDLGEKPFSDVDESTRETLKKEIETYVMEKEE